MYGLDKGWLYRGLTRLCESYVGVIIGLYRVWGVSSLLAPDQVACAILRLSKFLHPGNLCPHPRVRSSPLICYL